MSSSTRRGKRAKVVPAMAAGVLLLVASMIVGVLYIGKLKNEAKGGEREEAAAEELAGDGASSEAGGELPERPKPAAESSEPVDPFAGLADPFVEASPESVGGRTPEPGELTGSELWQGAMKIAGRVPGRLMLATEAREQGRPAEEKTYRREAIAALNQALRSTDEWVREEVSQCDPADLQVRSVVQLRGRWSEQLAKLRAEDAR